MHIACTGRNVHVVGQYGCGSSSVSHRPTESEVADLHMAVSVQQQVGRFDVSVEKVCMMCGRG